MKSLKAHFLIDKQPIRAHTCKLFKVSKLKQTKWNRRMLEENKSVYHTALYLAAQVFGVGQRSCTGSQEMKLNSWIIRTPEYWYAVVSEHEARNVTSNVQAISLRKEENENITHHDHSAIRSYYCNSSVDVVLQGRRHAAGPGGSGNLRGIGNRETKHRPLDTRTDSRPPANANIARLWGLSGDESGRERSRINRKWGGAD